jgi:hypothetical protein
MKGLQSKEGVMRIAVWLGVSAAIMMSCRWIDPLPTGQVRLQKNDYLGANYDRYSCDGRISIPDADPAGIMIGPVLIPDDGSALEGVVLQVRIVHPSPEDLRLSLVYDSDNDGRADIRAPLELYRARTGWGVDRDPFACPSVLNGTYYFRDDGMRHELEEASLSLFNGLHRGGRFYLEIADTLREDVGIVLGWSLYLQKPTTAARS